MHPDLHHYCWRKLNMDQLSPDKGAQSQSASEQLSTFFINNFPTLDQDKDGFVNNKELVDARASQNFRGDDLNLLDILIDKQHTLEGINPDERHVWRDNDGITLADMSVFSTVYKDLSERAQQNSATVDFLTGNFSIVDKNNDGLINEAELTAAAANPAFSEDERKLAIKIASSSAYYNLINSSDDHYGYEYGGITMQDLQQSGRIGTSEDASAWHPHPIETLLRYLEESSKYFPTASEVLDVFSKR